MGLKGVDFWMPEMLELMSYENVIVTNLYRGCVRGRFEGIAF